MKLWHHVAAALQGDKACVLVRIENASGSVPRGVGAGLVVLGDGGFHGTIGGGQLEWQALRHAISLLKAPDIGSSIAEMTYPLGPNLGQCCGGSVTLSYRVLTPNELAEAGQAAAQETEPHIPVALFGAGHVGKAMALAFGPLPVSLAWIDQRADQFPSAMPTNVTPFALADPAAHLAKCDRDAAILILTHSHALDLEILSAALSQEFGFIGLIGSKTKRQRFISQLQKAGFGNDVGARFHCPIGVEGVTSKQPNVIAASVAAQILREKSHFLID